MGCGGTRFIELKRFDLALDKEVIDIEPCHGCKDCVEINRIQDMTEMWGYELFMKINQKRKEGFEGYDKTESRSMLVDGLLSHIHKGLEGDNLIDIAAYCMFLWNVDKKKGDSHAKP